MDNKYNYFTPSNKIYILIIGILILFIFLSGENIVGSISLIVYLVIIVYNMKKIKIKKYEWEKFIEDFSSKLDVATRSTLVKLPFPLIIIGSKGTILWYNQNSRKIMQGEDIFSKHIENIVGKANLKHIFSPDKKCLKYIKIKDRYYDIYTSDVNTLNEKIILIYFFDVSEKIELFRQIEENKESVILVEVDNLDEVIKTTEEDKKPLLIAEIERNINSYAQNLNAILKKYSSNKYILILQNKVIKKEMEKKFDILDTIRDINIGNKLAVTLSIGVGLGGKTPLENYKLAVSAKELALGRGGDQAILKNKEKILFYGGNTKEVEKRTKVRARVISHALVDLINESSNVFIMGHVNSDTDCLGAAIGLQSVISALNKKCFIVLENTNSSLKYLLDKIHKNKEYNGVFIGSKQCKNISDENSLLILVDVNNKKYIENPNILEYVKRVVIIDHHRKSVDQVENAILSYIEPYASSTSELVTEMIQYMLENYKLKPIQAEALLAGICIDTKNFYFKTGVRTFEAAAFLRKLGADTVDIKKVFSNDLDMYIKKSEIIKSAVMENNIAIAIAPPNSANNILAAQAADELLNITGVQASFVIVKIEEDVIISARSFGDINVQLILESLGGGGHMTMAGATILNSSVEEVKTNLKSVIDKYLREGEQK